MKARGIKKCEKKRKNKSVYQDGTKHKVQFSIARRESKFSNVHTSFAKRPIALDKQELLAWKVLEPSREVHGVQGHE
jgi:hypothetical protein